MRDLDDPTRINAVVVLTDGEYEVGELIRCEVVDSAGVDLVVRPVGAADSAT